MATRIKENQFKAVVFIFLFTFLILQTLLSNAQSYSRTEQDFYRGFVAPFGTHIADIKSDIEHINQSTLLQAGGQIGPAAADCRHQFWRAPIGKLGKKVPGTDRWNVAHAYVLQGKRGTADKWSAMAVKRM